MNTQPKKRKIKSIITITILTILLLLLIFSEDIIKLQNKNKVGLSENIEGEQIITEPNIPRISAGMIPIKWDGAYWEITTKNDVEWYDYVSGKPAYMMLNDGVYQSELIRDMEGKKLVEENIGAQIQETELGTIFMWIPRFEINEDSEEIKYIKDVGIAEEGWKIPELFMYKQKLETVPDFLLTGVWLEKEVDTSYSSKITEMNKEDGIYGFIANVVGVGVLDDSITDPTAQKTIQIYANAVGVGVLDDPITDPTNTNRIILKIINDKNQDPIKAYGSYNRKTGKIEIQVTYATYGISKIIDEEKNELYLKKENGVIKTDTGEKVLENIKNSFEIIDNKNNKKYLEIYIPGIYVNLYTDGTLAFCSTEKLIKGKELLKSYGNIINSSENNFPKWYEDRTNITQVQFVDKIEPTYINYWFNECTNLTTIKDINNLCTDYVQGMKQTFCGVNLTSLDLSGFNTSNVTDMTWMFGGCKNLINLNISNFDTKNVTNMCRMFEGCESLTSLDLSSFNTINVTDMSSMFEDCKKLTSLDLSSFNTSNVTNMSSMFRGCNNITSLNLERFNTSKVTSMRSMFHHCFNLKSVSLISFDTRKVTDMSCMFYNCYSLTSLYLDSFNTVAVKNMYWMFYNAYKLKYIYVGSNWTTSNADTTDMFKGCGTTMVSQR